MARHRTLRASDADRDQVVDRLRNAAAEGRLAAHEFEQRVGAALKARTYGELDATVSDLPGQRTQQRFAVASLRAHPMLLLAAIPVVIVAVALLAAITVASLALGAALYVLTRRRVTYFGPYTYRRGLGQYGRVSRRTGYWA